MKDNKKYWLRGGIIGFCVAIFVIILSYLIPIIFCSDFFRIGPLVPQDQSICQFLVISNSLRSHYFFPRILLEWLPAFYILVPISAIIGWLYGKIRN
jgi:hypothetical protein